MGYKCSYTTGGFRWHRDHKGKTQRSLEMSLDNLGSMPCTTEQVICVYFNVAVQSSKWKTQGIPASIF